MNMAGRPYGFAAAGNTNRNNNILPSMPSIGQKSGHRSQYQSPCDTRPPPPAYRTPDIAAKISRQHSSPRVRRKQEKDQITSGRQSPRPMRRSQSSGHIHDTYTAVQRYNTQPNVGTMQHQHLHLHDKNTVNSSNSSEARKTIGGRASRDRETSRTKEPTRSRSHSVDRSRNASSTPQRPQPATNTIGKGEARPSAMFRDTDALPHMPRVIGRRDSQETDFSNTRQHYGLPLASNMTGVSSRTGDHLSMLRDTGRSQSPHTHLEIDDRSNKSSLTTIQNSLSRDEIPSKRETG